MQRKKLIFLLKWAVKDGLLNQLLQCWIKEKEKEIVDKSEFNKENLQILVILIKHVRRVLPKSI